MAGLNETADRIRTSVSEQGDHPVGAQLSEALAAVKGLGGDSLLAQACTLSEQMYNAFCAATQGVNNTEVTIADERLFETHLATRVALEGLAQVADQIQHALDSLAAGRNHTEQYLTQIGCGGEAAVPAQNV